MGDLEVRIRKGEDSQQAALDGFSARVSPEMSVHVREQN
jgi:hypothetical protein